LPRTTEPLTESQRDALARLLDDAASDDTVALVAVHKSKTIVDLQRSGSEGRLFPLYSITKMFTGFAIGLLLAEGRLTLDAPLSRFFSEWGEGEKSRVTVEHILRHTSGLPHIESAEQLDRAPDTIAYARSLPLDAQPGTRFAYSNEGVALLSAIVRSAAGEPLDDFVRERVLTPMGIDRFQWWRDDAGTPGAFGGLTLSAHALARVGEMLLHDGAWRDVRVLPEGWVAHMTSRAVKWSGVKYGLLTMVLPDPAYQDSHSAIAFGHAGTGNQCFFVAPRSELVIVRFRASRGDDTVPFTRDVVRVADAFR
jgi:CubicO group peptidase (beta-lactamase class C family)